MTVQTIETKREPMGSKVAKWLVRQGFRDFRVYNHEPEDKSGCQWIRWQRFGTLWRWNSERNGVSYRKLTKDHGESVFLSVHEDLLLHACFTKSEEAAILEFDALTKTDNLRAVYLRLALDFECPYLPSKKVRAVPTRLQKFVEAYRMKCVRLNAFDFVIFA